MGEKKTELQSGNEPVKENPKKGKRGSAKKFVENTIRDSETAKQRGHNGGVKSGETRRANKDARESVRYMLDLAAKGKIKENLKELGFPDDEQTNMAALQARLFTMAMAGNLDAYIQLMKMGGYEPEENRKERESISSDRRRDIEVQAKLEAIGNSGENANIALNMGDEDGHSDVVIYIPKMMDESECLATEDGKTTEEPAEEKTEETQADH